MIVTSPVAPDTVTFVPPIIEVTIPVKFTPLIAAAVPVSLDALSEVILLAGSVPLLKLLALRLVSDAPEPLNVAAVVTPLAFI